jgi:GNAT superfamily N-acetyltransferase
VEQVLDRAGRVLVVRDVTSADQAAVGHLLAHLSPRSARQRFLSTSARAGWEYVQALADPARTVDAVLVESGARVVAVGSTHPVPGPGPDRTVEFAVAVDDDDQGHGIGTLIVEELAARSRRRRVTTMVGTVLGTNTQMFDVVTHLGLPYRSVVEEGTAVVTLTLAPERGFSSAHAARAEAARAAAVRPLLAPTAVAVYPPRDRSRVRLTDWAGRPEVPVSAITRAHDRYDVPAGVELALIPDWLKDTPAATMACAEAGVPAIVLFGRDRTSSWGHGDVTRRRALDHQLVDRVRAAGARIVGPGSACVANTNPLVRLHVGPAPRVTAGSVGVVTDDPTCLGPLNAQLAARGLGTSVVVDVGDAVDLGVGDVVAWLARDSRTEVIVVALRASVPDGLLAQLAGVHERDKPVLFLTRGHRDAELQEGRGAGPVRAASLVDVADLAMLFVLRGQPSGRRVVVVTNEPWTVHAGANRRLARGALSGPDLTQHSEMRIHFLMPGSTARGAVLSLPPDASSAQVQDVLETLADDPGVDAIVIDLAPSESLHRQGLWRRLRELPRERTMGRPAPVVVAVDPKGARHHGTLPVFATATEALDALARTCPHPTA